MIARPPLSAVRIVVAALVRVVVIGVVAYAAMRLVAAASGPVAGANIGAGIAALLTGPVVILAWAAHDGTRLHWPALWIWAVTSVLGGLAYALREHSVVDLAVMALGSLAVAVVGVALGILWLQRRTRSG